MKKPFREHHLLQLLEAYDQQELPLDLHLNNYFRKHKALGSKDRAFIAESTYSLIRWLGLIRNLIESLSLGINGSSFYLLLTGKVISRVRKYLRTYEQVFLFHYSIF